MNKTRPALPSGQDGPRKRPKHARFASPSKDVAATENDFMDNLLAGIDASMFDDLVSSPVRPKSSQQRSPLRPKTRSPTTAISATRRAKVVKVEYEPPLEPSVVYKLDPPIYVESEVGVKVEAKPQIHDHDLLVDFDMGDLSAFDDDLFGESQLELKYPIRNPTVPKPPPGYRPTPWARCVVKGVVDGLRFSDGVIPPLDTLGPGSPSTVALGKTLVVTTKEGVTRVVHLKERWADLAICKGDIVNIISSTLNDPSLPIILTFKDPASFLILHPDLMLTMTSIANAMPCPRRPILQSLVKIPGPPSKSVLYGTMLHSLLQDALQQQDFSVDTTRKRLDAEMSKEERRMEIWGTGMSVEDVKNDVEMKACSGFESFGRKWIGPSPTGAGELHTTPGDSPSLLAINGLHEVEEDIWSPKWGLKGKVDASVQASIILDTTKRQTEVKENVAPLEIKTGRSVGVMAHRAQTMLYTLLMEERYGVPVPAGLLYYSQLDSILRVEARPNEIRALIFARNELASYLSKHRQIQGLSPSIKHTSTSESPGAIGDIEESFLPPTIDNARECKTCYAVDTCMLYRKTVDRVPVKEDDDLAESYKEKMGHMTERHVEFFRKWEALVSVEERELGRFRSQLWTMSARQREKTGRCFSDMIISSYSNDIGKSMAKIHRHTYTFMKSPQSSNPSGSLLSGHIAKGDPVTLSIEPDLLSLTRGFVIDLTSTSITIGVTYILDVYTLLARTSHRGDQSHSGRIVFRIDKDEMSTGMTRLRSNLSHLFHHQSDPRIRSSIVDLTKPSFSKHLSPLPNEIPDHLNEDQRKAMEKVLTAEDYSLILGMPGTGKTTTIAEIIKVLVKRGKTILLSSYTHSAVDTILMKLLNEEFGILRIGNIDKVHPEVKHLTLEAMGDSFDMEELNKKLMDPPVVAATCLAVDHPLFFKRKFDYCIVDEASQITLPTCLGPIRMANTFILVGDHYQLPPIVKSPLARQGGLDISLFKLLSTEHPESVTDLSLQYRMNEDIMMLSNRLIYDGRLKCGSEQVAKQSLILSHRKECREMFGGSTCGASSHSSNKVVLSSGESILEIGDEQGQGVGGVSGYGRNGRNGGHEDEKMKEGCWIQDLFEERVKAVFVDTDHVPARDSKVGDLVQNEGEAELVCQLATALVSSGITQQSIAVITPYRQQIKLLSGRFSTLPNVEILTADRSQGRDKDVILISLVRSNESGYIGDLLRDWRRINVSFTRAKRKLVIFGSARTLSSDKLLGDFIGLMESQGWMYRLKKGADGQHIRQGCDSEG